MKKHIQASSETQTDPPPFCISREEKFVNNIFSKNCTIDDYDSSMTVIDSNDRQVIERGKIFDLVSRK
jgi:hypothetical protein